MLEAGRMAALRLRHSRLQAEQRLTLIAALEELGLTKEAEKLDKQQLATRSGVSAAVGAYVRSGSGSTQKDRIQKLIDKGKRETAARALANELTSLIRQAASMGMQAYHFQYQNEQYRKKLEGYKMTDEVLQILEPGDTQNFRKLGDFAMANEILGQKEAAIDYYRKALQLRENYDAYRVKLIFLLAKEDMEAAIGLFSKLDKQAGALLAGEIASRMQYHEFELSERLDAIEVAVRFLESQKPPATVDLTWLDNVCGLLAGQMHHNSGQLPSMYTPKSRRSSESGGKHKEIVERRRRLHRQLCRRMLQHPSVARQGFTHLLAATTANEESEDEFVDLAAQVLMQKPAKKNTSSAAMAVQMYVNYNNDSSNIPFRSPAEFLVRHSYQNQDWKTLDDQVIPAMKLSEQAKKLEEVQQLRELYQCSQDEFLEIAASYARRPSTQSNPFVQASQQHAISVVIDAWIDRGLELDILSLVETAAKKISKSPNYYQSPGFLLQYAVKLGENNRLELLANWLEALAEIHIGLKSKRKELINKHYDRHSISWNTPNGRMYVFGNFLGQLLQNPDLVLPTMRILREMELTGIVSNLEHSSRQGLAVLFKQEPEKVLSALSDTKLLADYEQFEPYLFEEEASDDSGLQLVAYQLRQLKGEPRKILTAKIEEVGEGRFGARLLLALVADQDQQGKFLHSVGEQIDMLQTLERKQQTRISSALQKISKDILRSRKVELTPEMQAVFKWISDKSAEDAKVVLEAVLQAKRIQELNIEYHNADGWLSKNLTPLVEHSPQQAVRVFFKVVDLLEQNQRKSQNRYYGEDSIAGEILARALNQGGQVSLDFASFGLDVFLHERGEEVQLPSWGGQRFTSAIRTAYSQAKPKRKQGQKSDRKAETFLQVEKWLEQLEAKFGDRPSTVYAPAYVAIMQQIDRSILPEVAAWAQNRAEQGEGSSLAQEISVAANLVTAKRARQKQSKQTGSANRLAMAPYHEYYLAAINDTSKPLTWRMAIAKFLQNSERKLLPQEIVEASIALTLPVLRENVPFDSRQQQDLVNDLVQLLESGAQIPETLAADYAAAWHERYLSTRSSRRASQTGSGAHQVNNNTTLTLMLKLYLHLGDQEALNKLLRNYEQQISRRPDAISLLVRAGMYERAARLVRVGWEDCELSAVSSGHAVFDAELAEKLPAFYEQIRDEDLRFFAQGLMICLKDPQPVPKENFTARKQRQTEFAEQFGSIQFKARQVKSRTLLLLASRGTVPKQVATSLEEEAGKIDLVRASSGDYSEYQKSQELVLAFLKFSLSKGNSQPTVEVLSRLLESADEDDWQIRNAVNEINRELFQALKKDDVDWNPAAHSALAPVMRKIILTPQDHYLNNRGQCHAVALAAHLVGGKTEEFMTLVDDMEKEQRETLTQHGIDIAFLDIVAKSFGEPNEENLQSRIDAVKNIAKLLDTAGWITLSSDLQVLLKRQNHDWLDRVVHYKLMTKQEMLEYGPEIAKAHSSEGLVWSSLALFQLRQKNWSATAESWHHAWQEMPEKLRHKRQRAQLKRVDALRQAGRLDEAQQAFAELNVESLEKAIERHYQKVKDNLDRSLENESKNQAKPPSEKSAATDKQGQPSKSSTEDQALARPREHLIIETANVKTTPLGALDYVVKI